eukprot:Gb_20808 [translate_table: standard]
MAIPVIDMANLNGEDRSLIVAQIDNACKEYGFFQFLNHGIPHSLLDRVKRVCSENYKLAREQKFREAFPVKMLNSVLLEAKNNNWDQPKTIENVDWEDVITIQHMEETYLWP